MSSPQTTTIATELAQAAEAIRGGERFLVTTHENPDGDALGSMLAMKLALDQLGKDSSMLLVGDAPLPGEYSFMPLEGLLAPSCRTTRRSGSCSRSTARTSRGSDPIQRCSSCRRSWSTSTTTTTTAASAT